MRIVLTGAGGMLGNDVNRATESAGFEVIAYARSELDVADSEAVMGDLRRLAPAVVINCAAWTDVDGAECDEHRATIVKRGRRRERRARGRGGRRVDRAHIHRLRVRRHQAHAVSGIRPPSTTFSLWPLEARGRAGG